MLPFADHSRRLGSLRTLGLRGMAILCLAITLAWGIVSLQSATAQDISWDRLARGLAVALWTPGAGCLGKVPALLIVRVDPERYQFATDHYRAEGLQAPITIQGWQARTRASILFNAGLFRKDYSYMGLLLKAGRSLGTKAHPKWKGLFVAEPLKPGARKARVLDLAKEAFPLEPPLYLEAAQSLMLVDATGKTRVRQSEKRARQTVVAEDIGGNILVIRTASAVTLWELAVCLRDGLPNVRHAMLMDGGSSSDVVFSKSLAPPPDAGGQPPTWRSMVDGSGAGHIALPAVIGITPRGGRRR